VVNRESTISESGIKSSTLVNRLKANIRTGKVYRRFRPQIRAFLRIDWYGRIWLLRNLRAWLVLRVVWPFMKRGTLADLTIFEQRAYSQNGEDGILKVIFMKIGTTNRFCVEFGVGDCKECNTRYLTEKEGWRALQMDTNERAPQSVKREFITPENINELFLKYDVSKEFDLLSIDVDYNTYWVWKTIEGFSPRVVVVEYNALFPPDEKKVVRYDRLLWRKSFGSRRAWERKGLLSRCMRQHGSRRVFR
jgi:hypothetical protein